MPLYVVVCEDCNKQFEQLATVNERDKIRCGDCGGKTRIIPQPCGIPASEKPFFSYAMGKQVEGNKDWVKKAKKRGWDTDILSHPY